ncbi:MAG: hypothetical protein CSB21_02845 [Deltaproteobacteria bacterium]|nr:MAG: hypothetical protein CSB21_02845 [Deltaproteobacteria bacterium]
MKRYDLLYRKEEKNLESLLTGIGIDIYKVYFVRVYISTMDMDEAFELAQQIKRLLPNAKIMGTSTCGVIKDGKQYDDQELIIIEELNFSEVFVKMYRYENLSAEEVAGSIFNDIYGFNMPLIHVLCGGNYSDVYGFVEEFNENNLQNVMLTGGVSGNILKKNLPGYVFTDTEVLNKGIVIGGYKGKRLKGYCNVNISHEPVSPVYTVNRTSDCIIEEIENIPAVDWIAEHFGIINFKESYSDWVEIVKKDPLSRFQLILEDHNGSSRFVKYDADKGTISPYFSKLPSGTKFRLGYTSPTRCVQEAYDICKDIVNHPVEYLFCYSCLFRKLYFGNSAEWELRPYAENNVCGAFLLGEISWLNNRNEFFNGSCCLSGVAEEDVYVVPDTDVFVDLYKIEDENKALIDYVLERLKEKVTLQNKKLLERLIAQQEKAKKDLYIDRHLGINNLIKYKEDEEQFNFDKLCMVKFENSTILINSLGREEYFRFIKKNINMIKEYLLEQKFFHFLHFYVVNENSIIFVVEDFVSESFFMEIVNSLFKNWQFISHDTEDLYVINRFVTVLNQEDMVEAAVNGLHSNKDNDSFILISDDKVDWDSSSSAEMKIIGVLNRAMENGGVVPYYQGINNNRTNCIDRYEALMRIVDLDGTVYLPCSFMDVAKRYDVYKRLSCQLIKKVFSDFSSRKEKVSINISAYDINSKDFREMLLDLIEEAGDGSNYIFEILEDEEFRDMDILIQFINEFRKYNVKIAIDDFGSGYSNLVEIIKIYPDYIKVDGEIIKNIDSREENMIVLETIIFMGEKLGTDIVAEYVGDKVIQDIIKNLGIAYSQGFYFSKPQPISEIVFS